MSLDILPHHMILGGEVHAHITHLLKDVVPQVFKFFIDGPQASLGEVKPHNAVVVIGR